MPTESYTRITAHRIFDALAMRLNFDTVDKLITRSRGLCHQQIAHLSLFTKMRASADKISKILNMNQDIVVELIFKQQSAIDPKDIDENQRKELDSLREYSEKMVEALADINDKLKVIETKYMHRAREVIYQWQQKQLQNAEVLTDVLMAEGIKLPEHFTQDLATLLFLEICNEKTFDASKQIYFAIEQLLGSSSNKIEGKVQQIVVDNSKTKSQLLQEFEQIPANTGNEQAILTELFQRVQALSSATRDYIGKQAPTDDKLKLLAGELQDVASHTAPASASASPSS